jgi:hypothetical protein
MVFEDILSFLQNTALLKQPETIYLLLLFVCGYFYLFSIRKNKKFKSLKDIADTDILIISLTFSALAFVSGFFLVDMLSKLNSLIISKVMLSEIAGITFLFVLILIPRGRINEKRAKIAWYVTSAIVLISLFVFPFILKSYITIKGIIFDLSVASFFLEIILFIENWLTKS